MAKTISQTPKLGSVLVFILALLTMVWSYGLVDRNLTLLSWGPFVAWQQWSWEWSRSAVAVTSTYMGLVVLWLIAYWRWVQHWPVAQRAWWAVVLVLLLGANALSHDLFNYLFNAKMVLVYRADPHVRVALDFPQDAWLRFMHNVHTPAPYAYGWTGLSLLPLLVSGQKFLLAYAGMRLWMVGGLVMCVWVLRQLLRETKRSPAWLSVVFWHPLVLIETVLNSHNDVWMMAPALLAWAMILPKATWRRLTLALVLILLSASIKYVTILLFPVMVGYFLVQKYQVLARWRGWGKQHWGDISALFLLVPLLTPRSQLFHPWYLLWALCFVPFARWSWVRTLILALAATSLLRYVPWLWNAQEYNGDVLMWQKITTWSALPLAFVWRTVRRTRE